MPEGSLPTLIALGRSVLAESELDSVLERVLEAARELTGARYAALGVLDAATAGGSSASSRPGSTTPRAARSATRRAAAACSAS